MNYLRELHVRNKSGIVKLRIDHNGRRSLSFESFK